MREARAAEDPTVRRLRYVSIALLVSAIVLGRFRLYLVSFPAAVVGLGLILFVERRRRAIAETRRTEREWQATFRSP